MTCENVQQLLVAYLDQELDTEEYDYVETHLDTCDPCARDLADIKQLGDSLSKAFKGHDPDARFADRVLADIGRESAAAPTLPKTIRSLFARPLRVAVAAILVIGAATGVALWATQNRAPQSPTVAITHTAGYVLIRTVDNRQWRLLDEDSLTLAYGTVVTGPWAQTTLSVQQTTYTVNGSSAFSIKENPELLSGSLWVTIPAGPTVQTIALPGGRLTSSGGSFRIESTDRWTGEPQIVVALQGEGSVFWNGTAEPIRAGQIAWLTRDDQAHGPFILPAATQQLAATGRNTAAVPNPGRRATLLLDATDNAVDQLISALSASRTRDTAIRLLAAIPDLPANPAIEQLYENRSTPLATRLEAGRILSRTVRPDTASRLFAALKNPDTPELLKIQAAQAIGSLNDSTLIADLALVADEETTQPAVWAAIARARYRSGDHALHEQLLVALRSPNKNKRRLAIEALGEIGRADYFVPLAGVVVDESVAFRLRVRAARAASRIDPIKTGAWLAQQVRSHKPGALAMLAIADPAGAVDAIKAVLSDPSVPVSARVDATRVAVGLNNAYRESLLEQALKDPESVVRLMAAEPLCRQGRMDGLTAAVEALADSNWTIQDRAVQILRRYGDKSHIPYLEKVRTSTNSFVRNAATEAQQVLEAGRATIKIEEQLRRANAKNLPSYRFAKLTLDGLGPNVRKVVEETARRHNALPEVLVDYSNEFGILRLIQLSVRGLDPATRLGAVETLRKLTGKNFGFDPTAPIEEREAAMEKWEWWWLHHRDLCSPLKEKDSTQWDG